VVEVVCVSPVVTRSAEARYRSLCHERTTRAWLAASTRFALLFFNHLPQFRVIGLRFFETNLS
jgi:hypothetical protein